MPTRRQRKRASAARRAEEAARGAEEDQTEFEGYIDEERVAVTLDSQESSDNVQSYECGICLGDEIPADEVVQKPCECTISYCKQCWNHSMVTSAPRCPSCRENIGFDYDSEKGEAKFFLYNEKQSREVNKQSVSDGMILFPRGYRPGTAFGNDRPVKAAFMKEIAQRARPAFLKMLRNEDGVPQGAPRTCVCGGKNCFRRMTAEERRNIARNQGRDHLTLTLNCDHCQKDLYDADERGRCPTDEEGKTIWNVTHVWSCERRTAVVHVGGLDVCEDCVSQNTPSA